ncbi:hypothetical protein D9M71_333180 [compost metagenome]
MTPVQKIVFDCMQEEINRDAYGVADAHKRLDAAYAWLDGARPYRRLFPPGAPDRD